MAGDREFEFGVPFAGRVLPRERWTHTGLRDDGKPFDWEAVFGRRAPRVVDLGCGNGRYLISSALARPNRDHLGIDEIQRVIDFAAHRANKRGLSNVRFVVGDTVAWLFERLAADSVDEIHIYHPQPYYGPDASQRRMLTGAFLERTWTVLRLGGLLVLQTDNKAYWDYLLRAVTKHFEIGLQPGPWPDAPRGRTRREIVARGKGLAIFRMTACRRDTPLAMEIPPPDFDANRPAFRRKC
jgi:tRNA (guanine-N7-)-methyltransferase